MPVRRGGAVDWVVTSGAGGGWLCATTVQGTPVPKRQLCDGTIAEARFSASGRRLAFVAAGQQPGVRLIPSLDASGMGGVVEPVGGTVEHLVFAGERLVVAGLDDKRPLLSLVGANGALLGARPLERRVRGMAVVQDRLVVWSKAGGGEPMGDVDLYAVSRSGMPVWCGARRLPVPGVRHRVVAGAAASRHAVLLVGSWLRRRRSLHLVLCDRRLEPLAVWPLPAMRPCEGGLFRLGRRTIVMANDGRAFGFMAGRGLWSGRWSLAGAAASGDGSANVVSGTGPWGGLGRLVRLHAGADHARP